MFRLILILSVLENAREHIEFFAFSTHRPRTEQFPPFFKGELITKKGNENIFLAHVIRQVDVGARGARDSREPSRSLKGSHPPAGSSAGALVKLVLRAFRIRITCSPDVVDSRTD